MTDFVKPLDEFLIVRNMRLMEPSHDLAMVILKGHLVLEEMLRRILVRHVSNPTALEDIRLSFFQALRLVQALSQPNQKELWHDLEQLNRIRNVLAHQVEPLDIENKIDAFLASFITEFGFITQLLTEHPTAEQRAMILHIKMTSLSAHLRHVLEGSPGVTEDDYLIHGCPLGGQ